MKSTVDLLLITWNRRAYLEKTLPQLFASSADFRLYCWDNGSEDGAANLIASLDDPRVVKRRFSKTNENQRAPTLWFLENAKSDVAGKIDDDILLPNDWIERIAPLVRSEPRFGMLACWIFMPEDWDEEIARPKIIEVGGTRVFANLRVAGQSFLARTEVLRRHVASERNYSYGLPIDQASMRLSGLINGYPLPILFAHNMDDPRSPHCLMNQPGGMGEQAALTARKRGFATPEAYAAWIAADAAKILRQPVEDQFRQAMSWRAPGLWARARRKIGRTVRALLPTRGFGAAPERGGGESRAGRRERVGSQ